MRQVINISLPPKTVTAVKKAVKEGNFISTSEFFRSLLRDWQEGKLLNNLDESRRAIKAGKGKVLNSLKDLR
ncbi:MAG: ribbon-helix-helix domain-containing protein [Patescibacteria group bacterium]|nr:ribbon-helix-helix domain-containing protein [Patescibacteria group bacterium]MBU2508792.1 ribbon-helix-helix domain-containing protein [Patescibacteria group bacterium]